MSDQLPFELPGTGQVVNIRAMSIRQVDALNGAKDERKVGRLLSEQIIPECLGIKFSEFKKFIDGDEMATLIALRRVTWGDTYEFQYTCPNTNCNRSGTKTVDLSKLPVQKLDPDQPLRGLEYEIFDSQGQLTYILKWHFPTVSDRIRAEEEMERYIEATKAKHGYMTTFGVAARIDDIFRVVNGDEENRVSVLGSLENYERRKKIREFVMEQPVTFATDFLEDIEPISCGVRTEISLECENWRCRHEWEEEVPIQNSFFSSTRKSSKPAKQQQRRGRVRTPWKQTSTETKAPTSPEPPQPSLKSTESVSKGNPIQAPTSSGDTSQGSSSDSSTSSASEPLSPPPLP